MDPAELTNQELVDYLVQAVEEQDVVFVLFWLEEMKGRGMLEKKDGKAGEGVTTKHSWKSYSALIAAVLEDHTHVRRLILEILLLHLEQPTETQAYRVARLKGFEWATSIMEQWEETKRSEATDATHLVSVSPEDAELWVVTYLPPHPAPESLTGSGPLPHPPPAPVADPFGLSSISSGHPRAIVAASSSGRPQVRLTGIPKIFDPHTFYQQIRPLAEGIGEYKMVSEGTMLLTFLCAAAADKAVPKLKDALSPIEVFKVPSLHPKAPLLVPPGPGPVDKQGSPQPSTAVVLERRKTAFPSHIKPVRIHIGNLPLTAKLGDMLSLLRLAGVSTSSDPEFRRHAAHLSFYATVPSRNDYVRVSQALHQKRWPGPHPRGSRPPTMLVERNPPSPNKSHPVVIVHGLPLTNTSSILEKLARYTHTGAYDPRVETIDSSGTFASGSFRCPSPASAQDAVREVERMAEVEGTGFRAVWRLGEPGKAPWEREKRREEPVQGERGRAEVLVQGREAVVKNEDDGATGLRNGELASSPVRAFVDGVEVDIKGKGRAGGIDTPLFRPVAVVPLPPQPSGPSGWAGDSEDEDEEETGATEVKPEDVESAPALPHSASRLATRPTPLPASDKNNLIDVTLNSSDDEDASPSSSSAIRRTTTSTYASSCSSFPQGPSSPRPAAYKQRYFEELERAKAGGGKKVVVEAEGGRDKKKRRIS